MYRVNAVCRTVWVKDLVSEKRQGANGDFDAKSILFRVASDRNYTKPVVKDGVQVEERPTDFVLCRANGALAEVIANHCTAKDGDGKLISRHLNLIGHFEMYQSKRSFKVENLPVVINNQSYNLTFDTEQNVDGLIFVVNEIEFLDKKPTPTVQAQGVAVSNVSVAPVVAQPVVGAPANVQIPQNAAPVAPVNQSQPVQQPVTPSQGQAVYVQTQAPVANSFEGTMNIPVVPNGYTGEATPF